MSRSRPPSRPVPLSPVRLVPKRPVQMRPVPALLASMVLVPALLLTGCAAGSGATPSGSGQASGAGSASGVPAGSATVPADLPADLPEGRGVVTANADGTRTVRSAWGTAVVPASPQRIVSVIGDIDLDALVALSAPVVGAGTQGGTATDGFAPHLGDSLSGVTKLAWSDGTPYEAIAALKPDLIFAPDQESAQKLAKVAPTVPRGSWIGTQWKQDFRYVAEVLGREAEADRLLAGYESRVAALRPRIAARVGVGATVASPQVSFDSAGVYVDPGDAFSSAVLTELGLTLHPLAAGKTGEGETLSFERLDELDADILFWQVRQNDDGTPNRAALKLVTGSPLWNRLPAVAAGRVVQVANRPWYFPGITAAGVVLDDVERGLLGQAGG